MSRGSNARSNGFEILLNGALEADEERVAHERVPDRHFREMRNGGKARQVVQVEIVTSVHPKTAAVRVSRRARVQGQTLFAARAALLERGRVGLGIQLVAVGADALCPVDGI